MEGTGSPTSMVLSTKYAASHTKRLQSQKSSRTFNSSGMWHCCVFGWVLLDISNDGSAFVFRVKQSGSFERSRSTCPVTQHHIPWHLMLSNAAVRTWNLPQFTIFEANTSFNRFHYYKKLFSCNVCGFVKMWDNAANVKDD